MRQGRLSGLLTIIGCLLVCSTSLRAQTARAPTDGLQLPDQSVTTQSNAASLEVNPAGLGFIESAEARYALELNSTPDDGEDTSALTDQHALFAGLGNDWIGGGFGVQLLDRPVLAEPRTTFQKYSLGVALRPLEDWSLGAGIHWFNTGEDRRLSDLNSFDLGAQWRPSRLLGFGLALRDVNQPFLRLDRGLPVRVQAGAAIRFFGGRLVFDPQIEWAPDEDDTYVGLRPRLEATPISGLRIFGRANIPFDEEFAYLDDIPTRFFGGVEFAFGRVGLASAASFQTGGGADDGYAGQTQSLWLTPRPRASLFQPSGRWVRIDLNGNIAERQFDSMFGSSARSFLDLQLYLRELSRDPSIDGVVFQVSPNSLGYGQLWELRQQIDHLRDAGKKTVAFMTAPSFSGTYLASAANQVYLLPSTPYSPEGIRSTTLHYAEALSKIGVQAEFLRIGKYKSAPESFIRTKPSEPAIKQKTAYIDALYHEVVSSVAADRGLEQQAINKAVDKIPILPKEAMQKDYVDHVTYPDEVYPQIQAAYGMGRFLSDGYDPNPAPTQGWDGGPEVAIVYIDGSIVRGKSNKTPIFGNILSGSKTLTKTLAHLGRDPNVKAIVLRVDSPGGSAVASDLIYREIRRVAQVKPVICSMGNIAASGGYYVAAGADTIFATPNTLTGSIGIFTGKFSIGKLAEVLGIHQSDIKRGERAAQFDLFEPWSKEQKRSASKQIHYLYRLFLEQVSATRPLTPDQVDKVARGRVWVGSQAQDKKLVDKMGGLVEAIRYAEKIAGISPGTANYRTYPSFGSLIDLPLVQAGVLGKIARFLGFNTSAKRSLPDDSALSRILERIERAVLLPLIYDQREPLALPPQPIVVQ